MTDRRSFLKIGGAAALASGIGLWTGTAARAAAEIDPLSLVDPELRPGAIANAANVNHLPPLSLQTLPEVRSKIAAFTQPPLDGIPYGERMIPGTRGAPDVRVYVINMKAGASRPGIVYTHGGGFVFGDAKSTLRELQALSVALDCCIVTVDYRLAPETTFAGSIEDNYAALLWTNRNAAELGIDSKRIAVMGESAGGGHAALLAITSRDRGEVPVLFQMLVYPMLDDRTGTSRQMPRHIGTFVWRADANRFGWRSFLGGEPGGRNVPVAAVPARNPDLRGLPPAFVGVGALDLFVDEDIEYARRLVEAAVPVELEVVPGAYHGFDHNPAASVAMRFNLAKLNALRRAFGSS